MVDLWICLLIYLFVVVVLIFIFIKISLEVFDSIIVSLLIGMIGLLILIFCYPPDLLNEKYNTSYAICLLIIYGTAILSIFYIVYSVVINTQRKKTYVSVTSPKRTLKIELTDSKNN